MDACLVDVSAYLKQLPAGSNSTRTGFQLWMERQGRTPVPRWAFQKHGGWNRVRDLAYERIHPGLEVGKTSKRQDQTNEHKPQTSGQDRAVRQSRASDQDQASTGKRRTKTVQAPRDTPGTTSNQGRTPEPRPLEPVERLRALKFRSPTRKKRRAPHRNQAPSQTRIKSVQSGRVQASKPPGKAPKSGSTT